MAECRVLFIAPYHELVGVVGEVAQDYPEVEVTVHEGDLDEGLAAALGSFESNFDVVISRGGTAQLLEEEFSVPVIEVGVSIADLYESLLLHNPSGKRCAIVGFSNALETIGQFAEFADFDLDVFDVSFADELPLTLQDVLEGGYEVVLCDTFAWRRCTSAGLDAHLLASGPKSVAKAFDQALFLCRQTRALRERSNTLWQLIQNQQARLALFSTQGHLEFSNLTEGRRDLMEFMREHLEGAQEAHLTLKRGRRVWHLRRTLVGDGKNHHVAFSITMANAPSKDSLTGIDRMNRDEVDRSYHESTFHAVGAGDDLAPLMSQARNSERPVMLEGELGSGKAQIAALLYLTGNWTSRPFCVVDCPLLTKKSWDYLMNSVSSPLYEQGETLYLKAVHALTAERLRELVDVMARTGVCERNRVIASADDEPDATEPEAVTLLVERLRCHVLSVPPLRRRASFRQAVRLFLDAEAKRVGGRPAEVSDEAMGVLEAYPWPKNYLELRQVLQRAAAGATDGLISAQNVREALDRTGATRFSSLAAASESTSIDLLRPLKETERQIAQMVVERCGGNQTEAARILGIGRTTLWRMLK